MDANDLRKAFARHANDKEPRPGLFGAAIGCLENVLGSKARRKEFLHWFTGKWSSTEFTAGEKSAVVFMVKPDNPSGAGWIPTNTLLGEIISIVTRDQTKDKII